MELFKFEFNNDGYTLAEYLGKNAAEITVVEIPAEHNGKPVTEIGNNVFCEVYHITEVKIPESVKSIGFEAFSGCESLEEIVIPEGVEELAGEVFTDSPNAEVKFKGRTYTDEDMHELYELFK